MRVWRSSSRTGRAGVVLACLLVLAGCTSQRRASPMGSGAELPDQEMSDFVLTETDQGRQEWTLYAHYAATYQARNLVKGKGVRVDFFDEKGVRSSQLTALEGEVQELTRDMTARGNVVLSTREGARMTTEEIHFLNAQQQITSDKLVRVEQHGNVLEGTGFVSDPNLHHYEFKSRINATLTGRSGRELDSLETGRSK